VSRSTAFPKDSHDDDDDDDDDDSRFKWNAATVKSEAGREAEESRQRERQRDGSSNNLDASLYFPGEAEFLAERTRRKQKIELQARLEENAGQWRKLVKSVPSMNVNWILRVLSSRLRG